MSTKGLRRAALALSATALPAPALDLQAVRQDYARRTVLRDVGLRLDPGAVCVLRGCNGSGKTTLLRIAAGLQRPTAGRADASRPALYLRGSGTRKSLGALAAVRGAARLAGDPDLETALRALRDVGLADHADVPAGRLSAGQRARLGLAVALACRPGLLLLDEPTAHLDDDGARVASGAVAALAARGCAVLVATHERHALPGLADARLVLLEGTLRSEA